MRWTRRFGTLWRRKFKKQRFRLQFVATTCSRKRKQVLLFTQTKQYAVLVIKIIFIFSIQTKGTGKTLAFLIPSIERLVRQPPPSGSISILILSPTRELAAQIEEEAITLCRFHKLTTMCIVGGTNINTDKSNFQKGLPNVSEFVLMPAVVLTTTLVSDLGCYAWSIAGSSRK